MGRIFETHAHYEDEAFNEDREELLTSLPLNKIPYAVNVGSTVETCHKTVELISQYDHLFGALGVHPSEIKDVTKEDLDWIEAHHALITCISGNDQWLTGADHGTVHALITWLSCTDHVTAHALMTWLLGH